VVPDLLTIELPREPTAPGRARQAVERFADLVGDDRLADLRLLTSELVSNAVKYGGEGTVLLHVRQADDRLRVEVVDQGTGFQAQQTADARDRADLELVGGWGLPIVQTLSSAWGSFEGSTHVWFEFDVRPAT
jgi:anti-sigma regulatory factor (Ser/Thr protein kinase)